MWELNLVDDQDQSELPRPIPWNSMESDLGCTSRIYVDNVTLTSQKRMKSRTTSGIILCNDCVHNDKILTVFCQNVIVNCRIYFGFDLILYVPSTTFQLYRDGSSWVEPVLSYDKCVLLKDHNAVTPVRLEPSTSRSRVKHSTTKPLRSLNCS